jgi:hypothetical protein
MGVIYYESIPVGAGEHKIDFLDLLNVESLAPSEYASYEEWAGLAMVTLTIVSNETVSYVSSEPGLANPLTGQLKGWYVNPQPPQPPVQLMAYFIFANDPTPVDKLSFTFSGLVIPELQKLGFIYIFLQKNVCKILCKIIAKYDTESMILNISFSF